ncbi:glycosyltransferase [Corynebacterium hylobatis]|uniref:4,4'-diaponeurosporenoate glycosyltransferase n=1 Tax=Corynebacterium hylobatis TaxID=1859290 RepID=A0A3S0BI66_9CORY|nr:glycosyltransferase [Corynebacterium hylobatis]RSZ63912.1 glycosyltransferase [Corynebacterium hylobatis]
MKDLPDPVGPRTVSVVIPCLNDAVLLRRCLDSLRAQQVPADEIIVVDNGSTDDSAEVARRGGARVVTEPRRGITWATLAGFEAATGDILVRIDADILAPEDYIARLHRAWDAAEVSPGRRVIGVTGTAHFELGGALAPLKGFVSGLYLGAYQRAVGSALGHHPLFGTNFSVRADWWAEVRDTVGFSDPYVHEDMHLSFAVRPDETVWFQPDLVLAMDDRALRGARQLTVRFRRGFYTVFHNWRRHPPHRRLAQRGLLGRRLQEVLAS